jgi:cellulose synthase/poly-beta-1,6-N-acetylglucosamine synthase-like glycosyltransferase
MATTLLVLVVGSVAIILSTWVLYPGLMWGTAHFRDDRHRAVAHDSTVAVVIATRDEPARVATRVSNILDATFPITRLSVVVAVDVTSRFSLAAYSALLGPQARVVSGDQPGGKAATLNAGVREARDSELLVFADVGQAFSQDAIEKLVDYLRDPRFGGVTGRYTHRSGEALMTGFAKLEAGIRDGQSALHSVVSTSGSIYAMRRALWRPLPAGLICDDLFTTTAIIRQGYRVGFCRAALALDQRVFTQEQQFTRRVRTLTGLIQFIVLEPAVLVPWRNPIWIHFVMHKVLRLLTPLFLLIGLTAALALVARSSPTIFAGVLAGGAALIAGEHFALAGRSNKLRRLLSWGFRLQFVPVMALTNGLRRQWAVWAPEESAAPVFITTVESRA